MAEPAKSTTRTYVALRDNRVVAYYSLAAGSVRRDEATTRVAKGLANHPVPIFLLARLAVDQSEKGKGLGAALLKDALLRSLQAADIVGCRAVGACQGSVGASVLPQIRIRILAC